MPIVEFFVAVSMMTAAGLGAADTRCVYVPRESVANPRPELTTFPECAEAVAGGGVKIRPEHLRELDFDQDGLTTVLIGGGWHYVRRDGTMMPAITFDNGADPFSEGLARTLRDGKIGYFDRSLAEVISPRFDWGFPFEGGRARVCLGCTLTPADGDGHREVVGGLWGYVDTAGREVSPIRYSRDELPE